MITVAGVSPSLDLTYLVESLRLGQIHRPTEVVRCAGGKALNLVRAANTLAADAWVVAILGGPTGNIIRTSLQEAGISVVVVPTPAETRTCVSIASADTGELTEVYENAAPVPPETWQDFCSAVADTLAKRPGWLAICGGVPRGLAGHAIGDLVRLGARHGAKVAVDTHSAALPPAVAAGPLLVKINRAEAAHLLGVAADSDLLGMARSIRSRTAGMVVLTDGTHGALAVADEGAVHACVPDLAGHYPVGSGDSFLGGLLSSLDSGQPLPAALAQATAAGVANALVPGPGRFDRDDVQRIRSRVCVTPLA